VRVRSPIFKPLLAAGAHFLCNVIRILEYRLVVIK
jgi:hypothetical protein